MDLFFYAIGKLRKMDYRIRKYKLLEKSWNSWLDITNDNQTRMC